jgi:CO dehydrogenase maturation factor
VKIALSGKGGVGKTTICGLLCRALESGGKEVLAIDADSNPNLAYALRVAEPERITPLAEMEDLVLEKTGARKGSYGAYFRMNPEVSDIPDRFQHRSGNIRLLVMGSTKQGGGGCACPEFVLVKNLISYLLLNRDQDMVIDMEAGLEHLGRGVTEKVDLLLVVVQPNRVGCLTASRIYKLAKDIQIQNIAGLGNMIASPQDEKYLRNQVPELEFWGHFPVCAEIKDYDREGRDLFSIPSLRENANRLIEKIREVSHA